MINKRLFGSPIPEKVREKLEQRQFVAGQIEAGESIQSNFKTPDDGIIADLSSRTPFVRMWTAVGVTEKVSYSETLEEFDSNVDNMAGNQANTFALSQPGSEVVGPDEAGKYYVKGDEKSYDQDYSTKIYVVNNHVLNYENNKNPNESLTIFDTGDASADDTRKEGLQSATPGQQQSNEFLKPPAGITSVTSTTEGTLGVMKKTTINFEVHNFNDFDKIYNKFFLRPGAQIFVDFGWDTSTLYDPEDLIRTDNIKEFLYGDIDDFSGESGIVTENQGDLEVLQGIVTSYDAKIKENGSIECSVELTSKNSALLSFETNQSDTRRIQNILDHAVLILGVGPTLSDSAHLLSGTGDTVSDVEQFSSVPDSNTSTDNIENYTKNLTALAQIQIGNTKLTPDDNSIRTGVYISSLHADDIYISWGRFEDLIINSQFGFGKDLEDINDGNDLQIRMDSSNSFTSYSNLFVERQMALSGVPEDPPKFILPKWWGNADPDKDNGGNGSYSYQAEKTPEYPEDANFEENKHDIDLNRIPIREIYINGDIIIKALKATDNVHKAILEILKKINEDSDGVFDWKVISGETDSELIVIDNNRPEVQSLIKLSGDIEDEDNASKKENEYFKNLFTFNIMSSNSIVKGYDMNFTIPQGAIGDMYAIQGMGPDDQTFPTTDNVDNILAMKAITENDNEGGPKLSYVYFPKEGGYRSNQISAATDRDASLANIYQNTHELLSGNTYDITAVRSSDDVIDLTKIIGGDEAEPKEPDEEVKAAAEREQKLKNLIENQQRVGKKVVSNFSDYYKTRLKQEIVLKEKPNLLPMTLTLTIYGITSIQPGDIFRVDYLPATYLNNTFFQTMKVTHNIGSDGWYTTLETQFRTRPEVKQDYYPPAAEQSNTILSPRVLESLNLEGWYEYGYPDSKNNRKFSILLHGMKGLKIEGTQLQSLNYINLLLSFTWVGEEEKVEFFWRGNNDTSKPMYTGYGVPFRVRDNAKPKSTEPGMFGDHLREQTLRKGNNYRLIVVGTYWAIIPMEDNNIADYDFNVNNWTFLQT